MTRWIQVGTSLVASLLLASAAPAAPPQCRAGHAVQLTIELEPPEADMSQRLQQRLAAEIGARDLDICAPGVAGPTLAHLRVSAPLPALSPAWVRVRGADGGGLERNLDFTALPPEARASAIATAADELLSSLLQGAAAPSPPAAGGQISDEATSSPAPEPAWQLPRLELGVGGGGALFARRGAAYRGELLARWRPLPRLFTTLRMGGDQALARQSPWSAGSIQSSGEESASGWHAGLDAGFELREHAPGFGLAAVAGLALARLHRRERWSFGAPMARSRESAIVSWELAANVGGELSYRARGWGSDLAISLLVPFTAREKNWDSWQNGLGVSSESQSWSSSSLAVVPPGHGFGEQLGGQLDLRFWIALD